MNPRRPTVIPKHTDFVVPCQPPLRKLRGQPSERRHPAGWTRRHPAALPRSLLPSRSIRPGRRAISDVAATAPPTFQKHPTNTFSSRKTRSPPGKHVFPPEKHVRRPKNAFFQWKNAFALWKNARAARKTRSPAGKRVFPAEKRVAPSRKPARRKNHRESALRDTSAPRRAVYADPSPARPSNCERARSSTLDSLPNPTSRTPRDAGESKMSRTSQRVSLPGAAQGQRHLFTFPDGKDASPCRSIRTPRVRGRSHPPNRIQRRMAATTTTPHAIQIAGDQTTHPRRSPITISTGTNIPPVVVLRNGLRAPMPA